MSELGQRLDDIEQAMRRDGFVPREPLPDDGDIVGFVSKKEIRCNSREGVLDLIRMRVDMWMLSNQEPNP